MKRVQDVPIEVLEYILTFLPLEDWKQASLVCQQWMLLCSSRKFMAKIVLSIVPEKSDKSEICRVLSDSNRKYHNFFFEIDEDEDYLLPTILETFQESLECVKIKGYYEMVLDLKMEYLKRLFGCFAKVKELRVQAMIDIVDQPEDGVIVELPGMSNLKTLYLEYDSLERACFDWRKIAPNLNHFYVSHNPYSTNFCDLMSFYSQQLCSLGIVLGGEEYYTFGTKAVNFPQVRALTVSCWYEVGMDKAVQFFKSFSVHLTELTLGNTMSSEVLASIVGLFPSLITVRLYCILPEDGFRCLSKLPNLKNLFLCRATISYSGIALVDCFNSLEQLSLKYVEFDDVEEFFKILPRKMPHVTRLEMTDGEKETPLVCQNMSNLQRLTVSWGQGLLDETSGCDFNRLEHLHELRLFYDGVGQGFSWKHFSRCASAHKLVISSRMIGQFSSGDEKTSEWQALADKFPLIERLEIARDNITPLDVDIIKRVLPNCNLKIISNQVPFQSEKVDATLQFSNPIDC